MKRNLLKVISIICVMTIMMTTLVGCKKETEKTTADDNKITIGVSIQGFKGIFMQYIVAGMKDYAKDMDDVELLVVDAEDKADKQISQVESFIAQEVDAIVLNPVDKEASAPAVDAAVKAGIPILTVNTGTSNQDKANAYVGSDDVESGEIQMQYIADLLGGKGNVVILHGAMGHAAQIGRRIGYMNIIDKYPDLNLLYEQSADWQTDKAMAIMENWMQTGEAIDAVACNNDTMAMGAQNAVDAAGKTDEIVVMGMDAIPDVMKSIKGGVMAGTIWQDGIGQGKYSLELAIKAARGEEVNDYFIPYELISQDNIDEYIDKAAERDELNGKYN